MFLGGIERDQWHEMRYKWNNVPFDPVKSSEVNKNGF